MAKSDSCGGAPIGVNVLLGVDEFVVFEEKACFDVDWCMINFGVLQQFTSEKIDGDNGSRGKGEVSIDGDFKVGRGTDVNGVVADIYKVEAHIPVRGKFGDRKERPKPFDDPVSWAFKEVCGRWGVGLFGGTWCRRNGCFGEFVL